MQASTARSRDLALKRYAAWLVDEGELSANPLLTPPKADAKAANTLDDDQLCRLTQACQGGGASTVQGVLDGQRAARLRAV